MDNIDARGVFPEKLQEDVTERMKLLVFKVQKDFCEAITNLEEDKDFDMKKWNIDDGAGFTQFLEEGEVFEKVGVCASVVRGSLPLSTYLLLKEKDDDQSLPKNPHFFTAGISGAAYPKNPNAPALSFSYRYFEMSDDCENKIWRFEGGTDLIPYILHENDCQYFHEILKTCCDAYDKSYYRTFKKQCDEHFYLEHRGERRGIGGIFFSKLNYPDRETCFQFVAACMNNIVASYVPIIVKNKAWDFLSSDRTWQLLQRGRSVEFNLICDKTTKFILSTPGVQYENILISLPPVVEWQYNYTPKENSKEYKLLEILRNPREWV